MLDELKDLVDKKVFTVAETKQIMKQRSIHEATLVRRVAKKSDFLRYASYEMGLEHLRRKRVERLKIPKTPVTVSDFALVRRQFHIFERALKRFKSDVGLWIEYIQLARKEGARSLVGRITARALQLHPNVPSLYILAASHELAHLSPSTARTLLQRGIRLNSSNVEMWTEYLKMELGFIESLRRRWDVLGITREGTDEFTDVDTDEGTTTAGTLKPRDAELERLDQEGDEGTAARKQILDGVIVKAVMDSAVQALPQIELFESFNRLIIIYPSSPTLRESLIEHFDALLRSTLPQHPRAIKILYTRLLTVENLRGRALVEGVRRANEMLISIMSETQEESVRQVYAQFALEWCQQDSWINLDENLKLYVLSSLQALIHRQKSSSPSLLCAHIKLVTEAAQRGTVEPAKALDTAKRYTSRVPESASVWIARLTAMKALDENIDAVWREARRSVSPKDENFAQVWTWGISEDMVHDERLRVYEVLLNESVGDSSLQEHLLLGYVTALMVSRSRPISGDDSDQVANKSAKVLNLQKLRHMQGRFLNTGKVWQKMFHLEAEENGSAIVLEEIYELWRTANVVEATIAWAEWLFKNGKGKEASVLIVRSKGSVGQKEQEEMETQWVRIMG
ncbi:U3 small nucleolar RNA-associated protein 6-domain-containing protein [Lentinula lateritia]|uniref:U3 small nucleolar RNA-associated protein 6-domain-containing protein n=1 Tax=Lentinula aff. lateritia TaxID=2804960 RepID=A0ACC1TWC7_9AGAR|nr:U3 small nucleolar RNA-associated protein 6-domain-containing protein [Lentinula aff. lateritia]KAJ3851916.1 U3 small nucleolar RNA-associated protein 6-domain-containing protein [Lentinula lateritia]